ncbi:MAG: type III pantothenate kinase [Salinivirgaceae bacterium]|nr:type III pantothenate kinase [Salinivirgaceae bacterium]
MSNLIIDEGNSRCKAYVFENNAIVERETGSEISKELLTSLVSKHNVSKIISTSTRRAEFELPAELPHTSHVRFNAQTKLPITIDYKTPETLGRDRIAAAVGARSLLPETNVLIIDMGTAITIDFIDNQGVYHGGIISPGATMRARAMNQFTGCLPLVELPANAELTGKSTEEALQFGILNGIRFEIDGYISRYMHLYEGLQVIVTGGDAELIDHKRVSIIFEPDLVSIGLNGILSYLNR